MNSGIQDIVLALREAREAKGLSQRALGERTGVPQSHVSKIENGGSDIRLSSLIEIARALDLELKLVPRKAISAVDTVVRSTAPTPTSGEAQRELRRLGNTAGSLKQLYPNLPQLAQMQKTLSQLQTFPTFTNSTLEAIRNATKPLHDLEKISAHFKKISESAKAAEERIKQLNPGRLSELQNAADRIQKLRNQLVHAINDDPTPVPAYQLDDNGENRDG